MDDIYPDVNSSHTPMTIVQVYMYSSLLVASMIACGAFFVKEQKRIHRLTTRRKNTDDSPIINA
jgi:hypothetical protein